MARSHIKLWWGHLVISNGTSRRPEEQDGEVSAFMIGNRCFPLMAPEPVQAVAAQKSVVPKESPKAAINLGDERIPG